MALRLGLGLPQMKRYDIGRDIPMVAREGELTTIAPSEVGPKPARPIPVYLAAAGPGAVRRVVDRADGWMPVAQGADQLARAWTELREPAAERGRERATEVCVRVNARYSPKPYEGADRPPFAGSVAQMVEDLAAHAHEGIGEFLLDLQGTTRDAEELKDVAAEVYGLARAAGL
ncbi:LLM class flavin-dependent oxidoreductase [Streptomyces sp. NPDC059991]|uniref:LLM class flavin-dependent oxidoreductase n=1 Tax=Streptomyces sp. NPDC059991 TaxID=3347028 RepID=UPI0036AD1EFA